MSPLEMTNTLQRDWVASRTYDGLLISPSTDQEGNKLQRPNSGFILQRTHHEAQYTS